MRDQAWGSEELDVPDLVQVAGQLRPGWSAPRPACPGAASSASSSTGAGAAGGSGLRLSADIIIPMNEGRPWILDRTSNATASSRTRPLMICDEVGVRRSELAGRC